MSSRIMVYVGTYTSPIKFGTGQILEGKGKGIYLFEFDLDKGELNHIQTLENVINPSYLVLDHKSSFLYAVNELKEYQGKACGSVSAFSVSPSNGTLAYINTQPTNGTDPCHVEIGENDNYIYVSNFMSGSVCVLPINDDGSLNPREQFIQHSGHSINPARQSSPHAHSLIFSPDGEFAFVPDLGLDKLMVYKVTKSLLAESGSSHFSTVPGSGPRHCVFHPTLNRCYLINELSCSISVLDYDGQGGFTEQQCVSSLPDGLNVPGNTCADVHLTPNGQFLYGSNRGHDSLITYYIDQKSGLLSYSGCQSCGGKIPRNFAIDPTGKYLLCANQDSDSIIVSEINYKDGSLSKVSEAMVPTPVCVRPYLFL